MGYVFTHTDCNVHNIVSCSELSLLECDSVGKLTNRISHVYKFSSYYKGKECFGVFHVSAEPRVLSEKIWYLYIGNHTYWVLIGKEYKLCGIFDMRYNFIE